MDASSSSSSSSSSLWGYDVFLSFRGEDTRNNFTAHLYNALRGKGINAFIDDDKLRRGEVIAPSLVSAIESSMFSIIVLSENYASSRWCLVELANILHCMKTRGQTVLPIFYNVDPSDVRNQRGNFGDALNKHGLNHGAEDVQVWRDALTQVANLSGWDSRNKHEPSLIKEIVGDVFNRLLAISSSDAEELVGMDSHFGKMDSLLSIGSNEIRIIGIWGIGGIGKTTIARFVYDKMVQQFEAHCFLSNVREESEKRGLVQLQKELLSRLLEEKNISLSTADSGRAIIQNRLRFKRVLIVLDDVQDIDQLAYLAGNHHWFGPGSRLIITTRYRHLLDEIGVNGVYEVEKLNHDNALKLFSRHAFKEDHPKEGYMELSDDVVSYARGLPLALRVLGSSLFHRSKLEWKSQFDKLKVNPPVDIESVLQVSYDGLDETEKDIFLDVACFFKGYFKDHVIEILDGCSFYPHIGIRVLIEKALISIVNNKLWMHDLLQEMGRNIVRRTSHKDPRERHKLDPGKRSRLWLQEDVYDVLIEKTGTKRIEGLFLDLNGLKEVHFTTEAFAKMKKLRLLKVYNSQNSGDFQCECASRIEKYKEPLPQDFEFPSNKLSYLYWPGCPLKSLPSDFHTKNLAELNLSCSYIEELWKGVKALEKFKFMDLTHCQFLKKLPDLSGATNLEWLFLGGCTSLLAVDPSLAHLKRLVFLSLRDCISLRELPGNLQLESLETLILSGCSMLKKFPKVEGHLKHLSKLFLDGTAIEEVPSLIYQFAPRLVFMDLTNCKRIKNLPNGICNLEFLETLLLSDCSRLECLPHDFGKLKGLKMLQADRTALKALPDSFVDLRFTLKEVSFSGCKGSPVSTSLLLPWKKSYSLDFLLSQLSAFHFLEDVNLSDCNIVDGMQINSLCLLSSLRNLNLSGNNFVQLPPCFTQLSRLRSLVLQNCRRLQTLTELPSSIGNIRANDCISLGKITNLPLRAEYIELANCLEFEDYPSITKSIFRNVADAASFHRSRHPEYDFPIHLFTAIIAGRRITEWISHQNEGHEVSITPSPNLNPSNFLGFAFCLALDSTDVDTHRGLLLELLFDFYSLDNVLDRNYAPLTYEVGFMKSGHIWLGFVLSPPRKEWHSITISFTVRTWDSEITIKRCGVRLMYTEDMIEYISPPMSSSVVLQELDSSGAEDIEVKRTSGSELELDKYDNDCGIGSSVDDFQSGRNESADNEGTSRNGSKAQERKHGERRSHLQWDAIVGFGLIFCLVVGSFWMRGRTSERINAKERRGGGKENKEELKPHRSFLPFK